ncbi:MAG: D-alanyl-D-alanine carboxypeptidase [Ruminococcaceae bacterium]|nr:D-alanyl-D-alanine carboxypeptidase [Oscillospiraceae bacterium]
MLKILCFILSFLLIFSMPVSAETEGEGKNDALSLSAASAVLIDAKSGKVLYEADADVKSPPASITKVMSLILIFEAIENGQFSFDTVLTCSETAAALGGSQIWLEPGETMSVHDLLKAVAVVSANDATVLLAEAVAGSEESFVALMNEKAKALGMNNTNFENSTGLDSENHYSSAYDVAVMSAELLKHKKITEYSTIWMDSLRNGESELVNTNRLVKFYEGCTGLKTGTTSKAGYCLSASAERDGLSLIAVVMSAPSSNDRFSSAQKLLNFGFANYKNIEIKPDQTEKMYTEVKKGTKKKVELEAVGNISALVKKSVKGEVEMQAVYPETLTAPLKKGSKVGEIVYTLNGEQLGTIPITLKEDISKLTVFSAFKGLLLSLFTL